jgi:hypothetical protein
VPLVTMMDMRFAPDDSDMLDAPLFCIRAP